MKTFVLILVGELALMASSAQQLPRTGDKAQSPNRETLDGGYIHGAAKLYLTVRKDGTYSAGLGSYTGVDGIADGTWRLTTNNITFSPTNEAKQIEGLLREANVVRDGRYWALVPPADRELVKTNGISFQTCLKNTAILH
jgi:hypothetical protein